MSKTHWSLIQAVAEAAVIAVPDPKWQERPLALVVVREGAAVSAVELRAFLSLTFAKWQLPDDFVFVAQLPHTSTGKLAEVRAAAAVQEPVSHRVLLNR